MSNFKENYPHTHKLFENVKNMLIEKDKLIVKLRKENAELKKGADLVYNRCERENPRTLVVGGCHFNAYKKFKSRCEEYEVKLEGLRKFMWTHNDIPILISQTIFEEFPELFGEKESEEIDNVESNYKFVDGDYIDEELKYVNEHYSRNLKKGQEVKTFKGKGIVLGGTHYVYVKINNEVQAYHPQDIEELGKETKDEV